MKDWRSWGWHVWVPFLLVTGLPLSLGGIMCGGNVAALAIGVPLLAVVAFVLVFG